MCRIFLIDSRGSAKLSEMPPAVPGTLNEQFRATIRLRIPHCLRRRWVCNGIDSLKQHLSAIKLEYCQLTTCIRVFNDLIAGWDRKHRIQRKTGWKGVRL